MAISTYSELQTAIATHLERDDLTSNIPDFIRLAEARHQREVRIREMLSQEEIVIFDRLTDLPGDFLALKSLKLRTVQCSTGPRYYREFDEVSYEQMAERAVNDERRPRYFAVHAYIEVDSQPDQGYIADLLYYTPLDTLSDTNTTNDLLTRAPDVYLYASLAAISPTILDDEQITKWETRYAAARDQLNASERRSLKGAVLASRVKGPTP